MIVSRHYNKKICKKYFMYLKMSKEVNGQFSDTVSFTSEESGTNPFDRKL
jgi:hypothetical protein